MRNRFHLGGGTRSKGPRVGASGAYEALEVRRLMAIVQPPGSDFVAFEAEDASASIVDGTDADGLTWERLSGSDPLANGLASVPSGGALIARDNTTTVPPGGFVTYTIDFSTSGDYKVYTRRLTRNGNPTGNSAFMPTALDLGPGTDPAPLEAGTYTTYDNDTVGKDNYMWTANQPLPGNPPVIYRGVTTGTHTLTIGNREGGYTLDRIVLSTNQNLTAAQLDLTVTPAPPQAFAGNNAVALRFALPPTGSSYSIKRGTSPTGPFTTVGNSTGTEFTDTTAVNGTAYYYAIAVANAAGESPLSQAVPATPSATAVPAAPTDVTVHPLSATDYVITFTPTPFANSFTLLRGDTAAGPFSPVGTTTGSSFTVTGLGPAGEDFFFVVSGTNAAGAGPQSSPPVRVVAGQGATAQYFNEAFWGMGNRGDGTTPVARVAPNPDVRTIVGAIDFDYGNTSPDPKIRTDFHSTVFTGRIVIPADVNGNGTTGEAVALTFISNTDGDGHLYVEDASGNQVLASSDPGDHVQRDATTLTPVDVKEGQSYDFVLLQEGAGGTSAVRLRWENPATAAIEAVPATMLQSQMDTAEAGGLRAPTLGNAPDVGEAQITFPLTDNSGNETRFELLRAGLLVGSAPINATEIRDPHPLAGNHSYTVRAVNTDGASSPSAAVAVDVPALEPDRLGAWAHYFNNGAWNGGRLGNYAGSPASANLVLAGPADVGAIVDTVSFDNSPDPLIADDHHSTVYTGKVTIPDDGDATPGETFTVTFINRTDDHGIIFVNGQVASQDLAPHGLQDAVTRFPMQLVEGRSYDFAQFQAEQEGGSGAHMKWINPVTGENEEVPGSQLTPHTSPVAAPTDITRPADVNGAVQLHWADNSTSEVRYEVRRSAGANMANPVVSYLPINSTQFSDATVQTDSVYYYQIAAVNFEGEALNGTPFQVSTATQTPTAHVTQVFVNGAGLTGQTTANGMAFRTMAGIDNTFGYPIPTGANQLKSIPWVNGINAVSIRFDQDVATNLGQGDLVVRGVNNATYTVSGFAYDTATKTGTWTLSTPITNDKVRLFLDDALLPGLDGEWADSTDTFPSGDGTAGGDFAFRFNVLRGDATQDGRVNALDLSFIKQRLNKTATNPGTTGATYSVFADLTADGSVNALDLSAARARLNNALPTGEPATALLFSTRAISR